MPISIFLLDFPSAGLGRCEAGSISLPRGGSHHNEPIKASVRYTERLRYIAHLLLGRPVVEISPPRIGHFWVTYTFDFQPFISGGTNLGKTALSHLIYMHRIL